MFTLERKGVIRQIYVWSDLASPADLREEWLPRFEMAVKTLKVDLRGPVQDEWVLKFTDLERPTRTEGVYEESIFYIQTHQNGALWEISTLESPNFGRTIDSLIGFVPKLGYVLIPPSYIKDLMKSYDPHQELTAFTAKRDYFSIEVSNPHEKIRRNFADLTYRSSNVPKDYVTLVEEKPVGPLMLTRVDLKITFHSSEERTCGIRIDIGGKVSQIRRGDKEIFLEIRNRILKFLKTKYEELHDRLPQSQIEELEDEKTRTTMISKKIVRQPVEYVVKLTRNIEPIDCKRIIGLFAGNFCRSGFFGIVERESNSFCLVRTTNITGGGEALIEIPLSKDVILVHPLPTTTTRTLDTIYRTILEKLDVDSILTCGLVKISS